MFVGPAYNTGFEDGFQVLFGLGAILAAVYATRRPHLPLREWATASAWRKESTTRARAAAAAGATP
ncbi:MAG TPA: hypothetical protein VNC22_14820, partial [Sporichthya sp.]|nr:hypothetical protein [Sporichthya sp.]